ncbi:MAG: DUF3368 domain-containing protein [Bacteroidota bacterium]
MPDSIIITDASPLIALIKINKLEILDQLFDKILITDVVRDEVRSNLPEWIKVSSNYNLEQKKLLELELDPGEASAISLALGMPNSLLIIDEKKGRKVAKRLGLKIIGTIGVVVKAKQQGVIPTAKEVLEDLEKSGLWISQELKEDILDLLEE